MHVQAIEPQGINWLKLFLYELRIFSRKVNRILYTFERHGKNYWPLYELSLSQGCGEIIQ